MGEMSNIQEEVSKRPDFEDLMKEVQDVIGFIKGKGYEFRWVLKHVEDVEAGWKEVVLTVYVKASVEDVLELWDELYEHVDVKKIVIEMRPD